jgi:hypothetical protein
MPNSAVHALRDVGNACGDERSHLRTCSRRRLALARQHPSRKVIDESMFRICERLRFAAIRLLVLGCQGFTFARQDAHVTSYSYK